MTQFPSPSGRGPGRGRIFNVITLSLTLSLRERGLIFSSSLLSNMPLSNFIRDIIDEDLAGGTHGGRVVTRFPPEPNGYLHIGHAKSICLNFGIARDYDGACHLRFDDTNPETESEEYARSIREAVQWPGFDWGRRLYHASDYFEQMYDYAVVLIKKGLAYVDDLNNEEISEYRGTVTTPGKESPFRNRSIEENLHLFEQMRAGAFPDGARVLRAKIDMSSPNMLMRDPLLYRIKRGHHYRTGDEWCIYPMYDFAHCLEDAIERITHSTCTLEFDNNRAIYDWVLENVLPPEELPQRPHQYEFARLNLEYTVLSKRRLLELVEGKYVSGWDDPRLPTLMGLRRRGVPPEAIRTFCESVGVTRNESRVDMGQFEHVQRDVLNRTAPRVMAVLNPLKVVITNYPEGEVEWLDAPYWPRDIDREGGREVPFARELYIEQYDFMEEPPKKFYRLSPGREVRLRYGYFITCDEVVKGDDGKVVELHCTYDPETRGGDAPDGRSPKGTIHWLSAADAVPVEVRLYDRLFKTAAPGADKEDFRADLNPKARVLLPNAFVEPSILDDPPNQRYQFERHGYFWRDPVDSDGQTLVFNRIVSLRDTWGKRQEKQTPPKQKKPGAKPPPSAPTEKRDPLEDFSPEQTSRFKHFSEDLSLDRDDALILAEDPALTVFFETAIEDYDQPQAVANWIVNELLHALKETPLEDLPFSPQQMSRLVALMEDDVISSPSAKKVFATMLETGVDPETIVEERNLHQIEDEQKLTEVIEAVVEAHPDERDRYRAGKKGLIGFFMGQVMRETKGKANPELTKKLLVQELLCE